ncbi:GNAT family N-acetyltransferase [Galbitalea sp. SE-J8]|uniref:GNAT family N-acetyltransferase n=1 Tax=Galbitalea sp. SE-J8 TaxID=3054952 RepID=UPI00259CE37F|nr:GNAT family N-acetyltransferase [Galbitalea sp. SE-J8]MDM4763747.1 GNAT family N-acetyltransferase [Galbitalea sp. SE-J8]
MPDRSPQVKAWGELTTDEFFAIAVLRAEVFYVEQRIDEQEFDAADRAPSTLHLWIADAAGVAAYLRTTLAAATGAEAAAEPRVPGPPRARRSFGRVAVRADRRGEGLAQRLIDEVLARFGDEPMVLHAQEYVQPLYARYGFVAHGEPYVEAGLPHILMFRPGGERMP